MDLGTAFLSFAKGVVGAIIPPIKKKYFDQPKLYLTRYRTNSKKIVEGLSAKNPVGVSIPEERAIWSGHLHWEYEVILRNNSEFDAYNIRIVEPSGDKSPMISPAVDPLEPLLSNTSRILNCNFYQKIDDTNDRINAMLNSTPKQTLKFVLEYTNVKGTKFYTSVTWDEFGNAHHLFSRRIS